jgi:exosortase/archaeosortase family protein
MYKSTLRRLLFVTISLVVPIIANGFRALGIVLIAHFLGSAKGVATDHVLYGWLFFSIVTLLLIMIGLPFREKSIFAVRLKSPIHGLGKGVGVAVATVVLIAAAPRLLANHLDHSVRDNTTFGHLPISAPAGCQQASLSESPLATFAESSGGETFARAYRCGRDLFVLSLRQYPARIGAWPVFATLHAAVPEPGWEPVASKSLVVGAGALAQSWSEREFARPDRVAIIASALWIDGRPARGMRARILQALNMLRKSPVSPIVATVSYSTTKRPDHARRTVDTFLGTTESLSEVIRASTLDPRQPSPERDERLRP